MALSPSGQFLAYAVRNEISVWRLEPRELVASLPGDTTVRDIVFDPDARVMAMLTPRFLRLWRIEDRRRLAELALEARWADEEEAPRIGFHRGGEVLSLSVFSDVARVWLWRADDLIDAACAWLADVSRAQEQLVDFLGEEPPAVQCVRDERSAACASPN